jgi:uncharacterized surface protein with fasciclin (FAS1) repeats
MLQVLAPCLTRMLLALLLGASASIALAEDLVKTAEIAGIFKGFLAAAEESGVEQTLKDAGPYTVFAPTDEAIAKFGETRWKTLQKDKPQMAQLLKRHMLPGKTLITEIKPGPATTLAGSTLLLKSDNGKVTVGPGNVTQSDIAADNGVIHAIDTVLIEDQGSERRPAS